MVMEPAEVGHLDQVLRQLLRSLNLDRIPNLAQVMLGPSEEPNLGLYTLLQGDRWTSASIRTKAR
jgi:hypothetical protein